MTTWWHHITGKVCHMTTWWHITGKVCHMTLCRLVKQSLCLVVESGELYVWGYGKAIGYKHKDIVRPTKKLSHYTNIIQLAAGSTHSLALTGTLTVIE